MQYSRLGDTGLIVSRLTLGTMTFTDKTVTRKTVQKVSDPKLAADLVSQCIDAGINYFDTADVYSEGESEIVLGKALGKRRNDVVISTKVGMRTGPALERSGLSRRHIMHSIDQSLRRLGTDWIDLYIVHRQDPFTPLEESLEVLDALVRQGKVRYIGFSNWSAWQAAAALELQKANGWARFTHGQMYYSLLCRDVERDVVPMLRRYGMGLTVWSPLSFGFLSGKLTPANIDGPESRFSELKLLRFDRTHGFALVDKMRAIAKTYGASVAQVALAWLLSRPHVSSIIVGTTSVSQLTDNIGSVGLLLSKEDLAALDEATPLMPVYPNYFIEGTTDQQTAKALTRPS